MNTALVKVTTQPDKGLARTVAIPVAIPDLTEVRAFAERLHQLGQSYQDRVWGWELRYEPEMNEPDAEVQVPDGKGGFYYRNHADLDTRQLCHRRKRGLVFLAAVGNRG